MTAPSGVATHIACALAEAFFGFPDADGRTAVPLDAAALVAAGRLDLWRGWAGQSDATRRLVGRFLRIRPNDVGAPRRFANAARTLRTDPDSPYEVPEGVPDSEVVAVVARHGQQPLELAARLLDEAEAMHANRRQPPPVATPGRWKFGWRGQSVVDIPLEVKDAVVAPIVVETTPPVAELTVTFDALRQLAYDIAEARAERPWQVERLNELFEGLRLEDDSPAHDRLVLRAGGLRLLNAPTGVGKSVLIRLMAVHLARAGTPTVIVVGNVTEALSTVEKITADLAALGLARRCVPLVSPRRLAEKAVEAAEHDLWERFDTMAYGCALAASMVDGPPPVASDEPCTSLRRVVESSSPPRRSEPRHTCPYLSVCGRHDGLRRAATADIVVTNHHYLAIGTVPVPVVIDGVELNRLSAQEFLLRRGAMLLVDEVDLLQSNIFDASARHFTLASSGSAIELPLVRLDNERTMLLPAEDRAVVPPLTRTRFLADQFLNYVLEGDLWLGDSRPSSGRSSASTSDSVGSGWLLPGSGDRMLLSHLFGIEQNSDEEAPDHPVPAEVYQQFNALFPDTDGIGDVDLPDWLRDIAGLLAGAVSNDSGQDRIDEIRLGLHETLAKQVGAPRDRREVANALLVRTWLGSLQQAMRRLTFAVAAPGTEMPAARALAEQLGTVAQHQVIPYGPLGYLLFGFRVDRVEDPRLGGTLSVQAVGGDPHTTVAQLGGTVALAAAGVERVVLGLSATAYFPGAAREHIRADVTYAMTDAKPGAFTTRSGQALDEQFRTALRIGGRAESAKTEAIRELGASLWDQHLDQHLRWVASKEKNRERCMLVGNSYRHAALLAAGVASRVPNHGWVAVVVPSSGPVSSVVLPADVVTVTIADLEDLPRRYPDVKVCVAPLSLVARGLNILIPDDQRSALASVWVCVRPPTQVSDTVEMFASVNAHAIGKGGVSADPVAAWEEQRRRAYFRLFHILTGDPRFSRLSRKLKAEAVAGMLVDMIQLAGRARRGGTCVELYLVDGAFHDPKYGTDIPGLLRYYYANLSPIEQRELRRIYGSTLVSWLDFAGIGDQEDR